MKTYIYQIETISNLHVGSGEINQGVVDNLVQRDPVTGFPVINASSLKGALRQHCNEHCRDIVKHVFGNPIKNDGTDSEDNKAGTYRFFDARMLSMPVRSDKSVYLMATCPLMLKDFYNSLNLFNITADLPAPIEMGTDDAPMVDNNIYNGAVIEDIYKKAVYKQINSLSDIIGSPSVLLNDADFKRMCDDDHLPIIARNYLNNGQSKNLWYEQVVPRLSRMYFMVMVPDDDRTFNQFNEVLVNTVVQIGGNASVGNGFCRLSNLYYNDKK